VTHPPPFFFLRLGTIVGLLRSNYIANTCVSEHVFLFWLSCVVFWLDVTAGQRIFLVLGILFLQFLDEIIVPFSTVEAFGHSTMFDWITLATVFCTFVILVESIVVLILRGWVDIVRDAGLSEDRLVYDAESDQLVPKSRPERQVTSMLGRIRERFKDHLFIPWDDWAEMDKTETIPVLLGKLHEIQVDKQKKKEEENKHRDDPDLDSDDYSTDEETFEEMIERKTVEADILSLRAEFQQYNRALVDRRVRLNDWAERVDQIFRYLIPFCGFILFWIGFGQINTFLDGLPSSNTKNYRNR
jgi:hypothetical protein